MPLTPQGWLFEWIKPGGLAVAGGVIAAGVVSFYELNAAITENRHSIALIRQASAKATHIDDKQWLRIEAQDRIFQEFAVRLTQIEAKLDILVEQKERD